MKQKSSFRRHLVSFLAFVAGVVAGFASLTFYDQTTRRNDVVLRNSMDRTLASKIQGHWTLTDLRVPDGKATAIAFNSSGLMKNDPIFEERWFCIDGTLYMSYSRTDGVQNDGQDHLLAVIPTFDKSGETMTIAFPGEEPHALLKRDRS